MRNARVGVYKIHTVVILPRSEILKLVGKYENHTRGGGRIFRTETVHRRL